LAGRTMGYGVSKTVGVGRPGNPTRGRFVREVETPSSRSDRWSAPAGRTRRLSASVGRRRGGPEAKRRSGNVTRDELASQGRTLEGTQKLKRGSIAWCGTPKPGETDSLLEQGLEGDIRFEQLSCGDAVVKRLDEAGISVAASRGQTPRRQFRGDEPTEPGSEGKPLKSEKPQGRYRYETRPGVRARRKPSGG